jgi:hypothetical protein
VNLPIFIPEWGLDTPLSDPYLIGKGGRDNPYFVQKMYEWLENPANRAEFAIYFEWGNGTRARNHEICFSNQYPQAKALFPTLFRDRLVDDFTDGNSLGWSPNIVAQWPIVTDAGDKAYKFDFLWESQNGLSTAGESTWKNYRLTTDFKITDLQSWCETHIYVRYKDANNFYRLMVQDRGGPRRYQLQKKVNDTLSDIGAPVSVTLNANVWYELALEVNGSTITAYLNGAQILQRTDSSHGFGKIGFGAWKEDVLFDGVLVR